MKTVFIFFFACTTMPGFAQQAKETIGIPSYDTIDISMTLRSTNYFPFCNKIYKVPRDCDSSNQSNCCFYETHIQRGESSPMGGQFGCFDGTSLNWMYHETEAYAKEYWLRNAISIKEQSKSFNQVSRKCFLVNQEVDAYLLSIETRSGYSYNQLVAYGTINGKSVVVTFMTKNKLTCNDDIPEAYRQLIQF